MSEIPTPQSEMKLNLCALSKTYTATNTDIHMLYLVEIHAMGQKEAKNKRQIVLNSYYCSCLKLTMDQESLLDLFHQN